MRVARLWRMLPMFRSGDDEYGRMPTLVRFKEWGLDEEMLVVKLCHMLPMFRWHHNNHCADYTDDDYDRVPTLVRL